MRLHLRTAALSLLLPCYVGAQRVTARDSAWVRRTMASLTLRQKVGQMVWPSVFADYVSTSDSAWMRVRDWIAKDQVGGFTMSVGSPIEMAAKLNAMQ